MNLKKEYGCDKNRFVKLQFNGLGGNEKYRLNSFNKKLAILARELRFLVVIGEIEMCTCTCILLCCN
jgi:hypothetical protein